MYWTRTFYLVTGTNTLVAKGLMCKLMEYVWSCLVWASFEPLSSYTNIWVDHYRHSGSKGVNVKFCGQVPQYKLCRNQVS